MMPKTYTAETSTRFMSISNLSWKKCVSAALPFLAWLSTYYLHTVVDFFHGCKWMQITEDKLVQYHNRFRGSTDEAHELHELYQRFDGKMSHVMAYLPCCDEAIDSHR